MVAGTLATAGLGAAAGIHAAWAAGSTWPVDSPASLADLVVGRQPMPTQGMCLGVAALLTGATATVAIDTVRDRRATTVARRAHLGARAVGCALAIRGVGGFITSALGMGSPTPRYRRWDLLLFSPLCLALSAATFVGSANNDG